jgi:transcription initiation factor IIF auxiliary subunit
MAYRIAQDQTYQGNNRWQWRTWIEAAEAELDVVEQVTWFLHHTFPQPVVKVTDRSSGFGIQRTGWGMFQIRAKIKQNDDNTLQLSHLLELSYPEETGTDQAPVKKAALKPDPAQPAAARKKRVFLSFGAEDTQLAANVRNTLQQGGYQVLDTTQVKPGQPWEASINKMIRESDLVMGLVTSNFASPHLVEELNEAKRTDKPTVALVNPKIDSTFGLNQDLNRFAIDLESKNLGSSILDLTSELIKK